MSRRCICIGICMVYMMYVCCIYDVFTLHIPYAHLVYTSIFIVNAQCTLYMSLTYRLSMMVHTLCMRDVYPTYYRCIYMYVHCVDAKIYIGDIQRLYNLHMMFGQNIHNYVYKVNTQKYTRLNLLLISCSNCVSRKTTDMKKLLEFRLCRGIRQQITWGICHNSFEICKNLCKFRSTSSQILKHHLNLSKVMKSRFEFFQTCQNAVQFGSNSSISV